MSGLPPGWATATIGDVTSDASQRQPLADEEFTYIDISAVDRLTKRIADAQMLRGKDAPSRARKVVEDGDILVSMTRPNLNAVAMVGPEFDGQVASTGFDVLRPREIDPRWLFYLARSEDFVETMSELVQGALYPAVRPRDIRNYVIPLAPLNEQKRIADKLDVLLEQADDCRNRLDRVTAILKRFRNYTLAAAVSGELTEDWRQQHDVTQEWIESDVQSIGTVGTGSTPARSNSGFYAPTGIPWITSAATSDDFITQAREFVTRDAIQAHRLKLYPEGTLLVAMYGEGKTRGQVSELRIESTINQACAAIIVDESQAARAFVKLALRANYLEMRELAEGGSQPNLNLTKIKEFPVRLPPLAEQDEIVRRAELLLAFADGLETRLQAARKEVEGLTPTLLARAFRGALVPQDPNDEPASVLLERIRAARDEAREARPKAAVVVRRPTMPKMDQERVQAAITQLPEPRFTFDDLQARLPGDYDGLKEIIFELLASADSGMNQVFDRDAQAIRFVRGAQ